MSVISNTTVLSNFAEVGALGMLQQLYGELFLATEVFQEIRDGLEEGYQFYSGIERSIRPLSPSGWLRLTSLTGDAELGTFAKLPNRLHQGEAASLAIAQNRGWVILTDDSTARRYASKHGIKLSGTIGSLGLGVQLQVWSLAEGNQRLAEMISLGYYSPVSDLSELWQS